MVIEVYTDGSATIATKPGGYGWVIVVDGTKHSEGNGHLEFATNNDAELEAAIQGLAAAFKLYMVEKPTVLDVTLVSDSQIVLNWASGAHRFKQAAKMNKYNALRALVTKMLVKTRWVEGHSGDEHNERCDKLANLGRKKQEEDIKKDNIDSGKTKIGTKKDGVVSFWCRGVLKVVDLVENIVEDYDKELHGKRESKMEIR